MKIQFAALILLAASTLSAQTISPLFGEHGRKASGSFTVTNNSLYPTVVTIQPMSFSLGENRSQQLSELTGVDLKLSEMSVRLGPQESRELFYDARCTTSDHCHFAIFANFFDGRKLDSGVTVAIHLPYSVYVCQKAKGCKDRTHNEEFHIQ